MEISKTPQEVKPEWAGKSIFNLIDNSAEIQKRIIDEKIVDVNAFWSDNYTFCLDLVQSCVDATLEETPTT